MDGFEPFIAFFQCACEGVVSAESVVDCVSFLFVFHFVSHILIVLIAYQILWKSQPLKHFFLLFFYGSAANPMPKTPPIFHFFKKFVLTQRAGGGQLQSPNTKLNLYNIPTNTNKYPPILLQKIKKAILFILVN